MRLRNSGVLGACDINKYLFMCVRVCGGGLRRCSTVTLLFFLGLIRYTFVPILVLVLFFLYISLQWP